MSENSSAAKKKGLPLAGQIFIALLLAIVCGLLLQNHANFAENYIKPFGTIMLAMVLQSVGLPVDGIALVAGVDRIFDMGRTTLNITGDASCAIIVTNILNKRDARRAKAEN